MNAIIIYFLVTVYISQYSIQQYDGNRYSICSSVLKRTIDKQLIFIDFDGGMSKRKGRTVLCPYRRRMSVSLPPESIYNGKSIVARVATRKEAAEVRTRSTINPHTF